MWKEAAVASYKVHLPGRPEENNEELQSGHPVYQPRLELSTSRIQVINVRAEFKAL
jgi:hypothetical protein